MREPFKILNKGKTRRDVMFLDDLELSHLTKFPPKYSTIKLFMMKQPVFNV
jgi:hypothetical protein